MEILSLRTFTGKGCLEGSLRKFLQYQKYSTLVSFLDITALTVEFYRDANIIVKKVCEYPDS